MYALLLTVLLLAPREVVLSYPELDCGDCGSKAAAVLGKKPEVKSAEFDLGRAELKVVLKEEALVTDETLADWAVTEDGLKPVVGAGRGSYLPFGEMPAGADVQTVSKAGEDVPDLNAVLAKGKVTVVDFYAPWCEPCRALDAHMAKVLEKRTDVAYRKINVVDWNSPVAKRYLKKTPALPYMVVYGKSGKQVGKVLGNKPETLDKLIEKGAKK